MIVQMVQSLLRKRHRQSSYQLPFKQCKPLNLTMRNKPTFLQLFHDLY